jgi:alpha-glucosidase
MNNSALFDRIRFRGQPQAHPESVVSRDKARFTVLTPRLLRLEWSETGEFEDRGTYAFPIRFVETPPAFTVRDDGDTLMIDTGELTLRYVEDDDAFHAENLAISLELNGEQVTWRPGTPNPGNLRGTRRTLDRCSGDAGLDPGLLSRDGWALFDDSENVVFNRDDGWVAPRPDHVLQDSYFFAYGHDYEAALSDYVRFGGETPLIPRFVLGAWWSRYWAYSAEDLKDLVRTFDEHDLPLDVLVIDMDWHTPHSWTGYTWNRELFPDPPAFLDWMHARGLRVTLNLHPAEGVQPFEEIYPEFAEAMSVDPESEEPVPFRITDKAFVKHYFEMLHHPMEDGGGAFRRGIDFWWIDWQQGETSEMEGLDPLPWLNHLHFNDIKRTGVRPMLYSRWGGLGNHRYYVGFSGDTYETWGALAFQPHFTATASNVLYGWWSHDIGGHMGGTITGEMYTRWLQFGALSPVLRLHATKDPRSERRPWAFDEETYRAAKAAFHLRYRLITYLYTMARVATDTGISLCRPMYYDYPEMDDAYMARFQYYLGDQLIAAPLVHPANPETGMAAQDVWVPPGTWIDYQTRETFIGPRWVRLVGDRERVPMLMQAGAILPLAPEFADEEGAGTVASLVPGDRLTVAVFPGDEGAIRLYEDDGITEAYRDGEAEWTEIRTRQVDARTLTVYVAPVDGHCPALPPARSYEIHLEGSRRPSEVLVDGEATDGWTYDETSLTTVVPVSERDKEEPVTITFRADGDSGSNRAGHPEAISALGEDRNNRVIAADVKRLLGEACPDDALNVDALLALPTKTPGWAAAVARLGGPFVTVREYVTPEEATRQLGRVIVAAPKDGSTYSVRVTFERDGGDRRETQTIERADVTERQIINAPFAFQGDPETQRWRAEVKLTWRGVEWTHSYASAPLFPTVYAWRAVVYPEDEAPSVDDVLTPDGAVDPTLDWQPHLQDPDQLPNYNEPHGVRFWRDYEERLTGGVDLVGYAVATVVSPAAREAVFEFQTPGSAEVYLNGEPAPLAPHPEETHLRPIFRSPYRTEPLRLREGENTLLIRATPSKRAKPHHWYFGGRFVTADGELMLDLRFSMASPGSASTRDPWTAHDGNQRETVPNA